MASTEGLDPKFASGVSAMLAASGGQLALVSGRRTVERQAQLWSAALRKYGSAAAARKWVAPPGKSNHNRGIAADIGPSAQLVARFGGNRQQAKAEAYRLIARLAPAHSLATPLGNEPWHVEPVGSRSSKGAPTTFKGARAAIAAGAAPSAPATTSAPAAATTAPDPNDRHSLDVQLTSLLSILDKPIDFTGQEVA